MTKNDTLDIPASLKREAPAALQASKPADTKPTKPKAAAGAAKQKPAAKKTAPKPAGREGLVTVVAIAKEYKLSPPEARALLRAAKLKKPGQCRAQAAVLALVGFLALHDLKRALDGRL
jgi:hypothetical protein